MNDNFNFENENSENKNIPPDFAEYTPENNDVEIDFSNFAEPSEVSEENAVDKVNNFTNNQNCLDNGVNLNNQPVFQPNYHGYQHSYQPNYAQNYNPNYGQNATDLRQYGLYYEKKAVRKTSNHIAIGLILFFAIQIVFSVIIGFFAVSEEVLNFINDPAIMLELNIILTLFGFGLAAVFIFKTENEKPHKLISYGLPKKGTFIAAVMAGIGFCYVANISTAVLQSVFQNILPFAQIENELPNGILGFILSVISVAIAPALLEEFLFRGAIMGTLLKFGKGFAVFTSAFIFALIHGNLVQIPFAFMVGLILGILVIETGSIWTSVAIHFANNFISVCMDYLKLLVNEDVLNIIFMFLIATVLLLGILGIYTLSLKNKNLFSYKKTMHISSSSQKFGWLSSSAIMIVYYVIIFLEVVATQMTANIG